MSKKATALWCLWIGILDGVYCIICNQIPHIQHYMWIGFISLPIFFCGGATLKLLPRYFVCATSGVLWGALNLWVLGLGLIADPGMNMLVFVPPVVTLCCILHMVFGTEDKFGGLFASTPMAFGGFAAIFSQGIGELPYVIITLTLGLVLGVAMSAAGPVIAKIVDKPVIAKIIDKTE